MIWIGVGSEGDVAASGPLQALGILFASTKRKDFDSFLASRRKQKKASSPSGRIAPRGREETIRPFLVGEDTRELLGFLTWNSAVPEYPLRCTWEHTCTVCLESCTEKRERDTWFSGWDEASVGYPMKRESSLTSVLCEFVSYSSILLVEHPMSWYVSDQSQNESTKRFRFQGELRSYTLSPKRKIEFLLLPTR